MLGIEPVSSRGISCILVVLPSLQPLLSVLIFTLFSGWRNWLITGFRIGCWNFPGSCMRSASYTRVSQGVAIYLIVWASVVIFINLWSWTHPNILRLELSVKSQFPEMLWWPGSSKLEQEYTRDSFMEGSVARDTGRRIFFYIIYGVHCYVQRLLVH